MGVGRQLRLPRFRYKISAEERLFLQKYGPVVAKLRRDPVFVARHIHGVVVPPHQRHIFRTMWMGFREYHVVGSRGTSKSASVASMAQMIRGETYGRRKYLSLSASKFRGGKTIMEEAQDFAIGAFKDQQIPAPYVKQMLVHKAVIKREGDRWTIPLKTHSRVATVPTGNFESARGLRATWLTLDEADNWERAVITKYFEPFLAVEDKFERIAEAEASNTIFFTGTVSFSHKDWAKTLDDREYWIRRRFEAQQALKRNDYDTYRRIMSEDNERLWRLSISLTRFDYTDLLIPLELGEYEVYFPAIARSEGRIEVNPSWLTKYDRREKCKLIYTYPFSKEKIEDPLDDGNTDFDTWAAENRCQVIRAEGNVFPPHLLDKATDTELLDSAELVAKGWNPNDKGAYFPPVLYRCNAPCVLGVDPARTSDFAGFIVIRMGELADPNVPYDPITGAGYTPYNNVIWAEAHRHMTIKDVCQKIYELKERYPLLISSPNPEFAYGIGIDARGAMSGATVRDELARPSPTVDTYGNVDPNWRSPQLIYDPTDEEYRHLAMRQDAWPGLRLLWTSDLLNTEWVSFAKAQLEQGRLYLGRYLSRTERHDDNPLLHTGYLGVQSLKSQLQKVQGIPTKYAMQYVIPGNPQNIANKDDLFKAFLYAASALRAHLATTSRSKTRPPVGAALLVRPGRRSF